MITLSKVASGTKLFLKWGGIIVGAVVLIWLLFGLGGFIKRVFFPTPPPPPTVAYGKLSAIAFPKQTETKDFTYTVDTLTGSLPDFPDRAKVFKIKQPEANLMALENAKNILKNVRFESTPVPIGGNIYSWKDNSKIQRVISLDIFSYDFSISSSYLLDPNVLSAKRFPDIPGGTEVVMEFLKSLRNTPEDIDEKKTKAELFSIVNSSITPASSLSNAQLMQIYLFQKDVDEMPIYYSSPNQSTMQITVAGGDNPQIVQARFLHQKISDKSETYPIKSADLAFEELQKGKAFIAAYNGTRKDILIKKITLGYYMQDQAQPHLMPIFVFEGNDGFFAYLPAVTDEWINR
jgi:hypothetical protein